VVNDRPKPLAPIGTTPFLEHQLSFLKAQQIRNFVLCVGYRHEQIEEYFGDGGRWGISITYSVEERPLGTGGALKLAQRFAQDTFLVLNGDTFFDLDIEGLVRTHRQHCSRNPNCEGTIALTQVEDSSQYGSVVFGADLAITGFREKSAGGEPPHFVSAGVYVLEPRVLDRIPSSQSVSLERDVYPQLLGDRGLYAYPVDGFFIDIGTPEGFHRFGEYTRSIKP